MPISMEKNGQTYYLHYDQVGTLKLVSDSAGNIIKQVDYDSYGKVLNDSDTNFKVPFGFAGGLYDQDTQLVRFGYRDYEAFSGRWTAKDPIGFDGGDSNLYGYVLGDPVNFVDPTGEIAPIVYGFFLLLGGTSYLNASDRGDEVKTGRTPSAELITDAVLITGACKILKPFNSNVQQVTHWGKSGQKSLEKGDYWVMIGEQTTLNWWKAGLPQIAKSRGYKFDRAITTNVNRNTLSYPKGWERWKGLIGQRIYTP